MDFYKRCCNLYHCENCMWWFIPWFVVRLFVEIVVCVCVCVCLPATSNFLFILIWSAVLYLVEIDLKQVSESKLLIHQHIQNQGQFKKVCSLKMLFCGPPKTGKTITMLRPTNNLRIPMGWMLLQLLLRHKYQEKGWCTIIGTAASCGITENELPLMLKYIHKNYGTILYYPDVLKNIVPDVILLPLKSAFEFVFVCKFVTKEAVTKCIRSTEEIRRDRSSQQQQYCLQPPPVQGSVEKYFTCILVTS